MKALIFISIILSFAVHAAITPMIKFPESFNEKNTHPGPLEKFHLYITSRSQLHAITQHLMITTSPQERNTPGPAEEMNLRQNP